MIDTTQLHRVASQIKTGWEFCDSRWQNAEAEYIALTLIASTAKNHREHGEAISWQGKSTEHVQGAQLVDNRRGMRLLIDDGCMDVVPYQGTLAPPDDVVRNAEGLPMICVLKQGLLDYAERFFQNF